jgi:hypothetical protein
MNAGVYQKEIAEVRAHNTEKISRIPILTKAEKNWDRNPSFFPPG